MASMVHIHRVIGKKSSSLVTFCTCRTICPSSATLSKTSPSFLRHSPLCILFSESCHRCQNIDNGSYLGEMDECDFFCLDSSEGRSGFCCRFIKDDEEEEELWKFHAAAASSESRRQFFIGAKIWRGGNAVRIGLAGSEPACRGFRRERCTQWRQRKERAARRAGELGMMMRLRGYASAFAVNVWSAGAIMGGGNIK